MSAISWLAACEGTIVDAATWEHHNSMLVSPDATEDTAPPEPVDFMDPHDAGTMSTAETETEAAEPARVAVEKGPATKAPDAKPSTPAAAAETAHVPDLVTRVGLGDLEHPVSGPAPVELAKLSGAPYTLVKNWDFGSNGTIRNQADLDAEFQYHDQFGTVANGTNYGSVTVASSRETAIHAGNLGLPNDEQPIEDPARPTREWTADTLLAHVRPLSSSQQTVSVSQHDAGNGSFTAKWKLPSGGALLGHDLVWETRVHMPKPVPGYWFALWTAGKLWDKGAEMDVLESFGAPHIAAQSFHSDSVGGSNQVDYTNWPGALTSIGVPMDARELPDWHTWTWVYLRDDSYEIYYDGYRVQDGTIHWTDGATQDGQPTDLNFLFDFSWGHTQIADVNIELPASQFPLSYEIDYSRVYMR